MSNADQQAAGNNQRRPENINPATDVNFRLHIGALPDVTWFCVRANLPGMTLGQSEFANRFITVPEPGTHVEYEFLDIAFIVDEELKNWVSIADWIMGLGYTRTHEQWTSLIAGDIEPPHGEKTDLTLHLLTNNMNRNHGIKVMFTDAFPITISSLDFNVQVDDPSPLIAEARFQFQDYRIEVPWREVEE